jgi:tetratricopeptide (TPR) repeat protein
LVTPAAEAIIHKLLAPEPADRYQTAEELKTDIERHLNDQPLTFAREPSLRERLGKWKRRNPGVAVRLAAAAMLGLLFGVGAIAYERSESNATARATVLAQNTRAAIDTTRLDLILPGDPKARARGIAKAGELLASYQLPDNADWKKQSQVQRLSESDRAALSGELGELLLLLAHATWQDADAKSDSSRESGAARAQNLIQAARSCFPADAVPVAVDRQAAELSRAMGQQVDSAAVKDHKPTARDQFLEAVAQIGAAKYAAAIPLLEAVIAEQPNHATAHFCLAYSRQQLGQFERALERYDVADKMMPKDPRPAFQRGMIFATQFNHTEAEREYLRATELAPDHMLARRNLGFARYRLAESLTNERKYDSAKSKLQEAETDLTVALELGATPIQVYLYRTQVRRLIGDAAGAVADQGLLSALTPASEADYVARGHARLKDKDWKGALDDFVAAAVYNPRSMTALQNQIHVLGDKLNRIEDALDAATRLTEVYPDYAAGRMAKAVFLARLNRRDEAVAEADRALKSAKKESKIVYRGACVYALNSVNHPEDQARALQLLEQAIKEGYREWNVIKADNDLAPIHNTKRFREIMDAANSLFQ